MPDNIELAIAVAKEGKMNPENFKKTMPDSAALLRGNFNRSVSDAFFHRILMLTTAELKYPNMLETKFAFGAASNSDEMVDTEFARIMTYLSVMIGIDQEAFKAAPYRERFFLALCDNIHDKGDIFPIDGNVIKDIFYSAYIKTSFMFQEEIETTSSKKLAQSVRYMNDSDGFTTDLLSALDESVTLPSDIETIDELMEHTKQYFNTLAITNAFVKSVRVIKEMPEYYTCLECWVCGANETQTCSSCKAANFCSRNCMKKAWKRNHKVQCLHFKRIMDFVNVQCQQIDEAIRKSFIAPGKSLLQPNQFFDYIMVTAMITMVAQNPGASLKDGSIHNFYANIIEVEKNDAAFRSLFKGGTQIQRNVDQTLVIIVCIGLMYNGNPLQTLPAQRITRDTFLNEYKDVKGYAKQSEEMVKASALEDLMGYYKQEDYSNLPKDMVDFLCQEVKSMDME